MKRVDFDKNNDYSIVKKIKFANYKNANTFFDFYMFQLNTVDDIKNYWNCKCRTIHFEKFCDLLLYYHSQMLQFLLIKIEIDFESRVDFVNFNKKINMFDKKLQSVIINMQNQKNYIGKKVSLCLKNSTNNRKFRNIKWSLTRKITYFWLQVGQAILTAFVVWICRVINLHFCYFFTFFCAVRKAKQHFKTWLHCAQIIFLWLIVQI